MIISSFTVSQVAPSAVQADRSASAPASGYGRDLRLIANGGVLDVDENLSTVEGPIVVAQAVAIDILSGPGELWWAPDAGAGVALLRNAAMSPADVAALRARIIGRARSDERVDDARVDVQLGVDERLSITVDLQLKDGARASFGLVLSASAASARGL